MMARHALDGRVEHIFLRPARRALPLPVDTAEINETGLVGDHSSGGLRAVTLIQSEHLPVIAALMGQTDLAPDNLRRNIVVSGLNLLAFRKSTLRIGQAILRVTGPCPPCSRMEEVLGHGGYSAMRGHGGVYAEVVHAGTITTGAAVIPI